MTIKQMRDKLKTAYPLSTAWAYKVKTMPADQVTAVYLRMRRDNVI